jgi:hypothetical protein
MDPVDIAIAISVVVSTGGGVWILGMLVRALVKRWSQPALRSDSAEFAVLKNQVAELGAEVAEIHERLDFAERVLTSGTEPPRVADGEARG